MTLAASVRSYVPLPEDPFAELRSTFLQRVKKDAAMLASLRLALRDTTDAPSMLSEIKHIAHGLAGAGGIFGFAEISDAAAALEQEVIKELDGTGCGEGIAPVLDCLMSRLETTVPA